MQLRLYDTLTREKRPFVPLDAAHVRMYACGPTVYDFAHIGNGRAAIVFDLLFRVLRHHYGADHVKYVRNITDVDDKINARAARDYPGLPLNEAIRKVTEETYQQYQDDVTALGCLPPTVQPRATEHIPEMRAIIEKLVAGGFAYVAEDHVLFSPSAMNAANKVLPRYGALSKRSLDEMIAGARVDVAPYKRDNTDFVLWKPSKPGEPSWPSPAGIATPGRPGWHIECSAMAWKHLGERFDIHGGGIDLVFPHHENELAQRFSAGRKREDVEEPRQLLHHPRSPGRLAGRGAAPFHAEDALPLAAGLDIEERGRKHEDAGRLVCVRSRRQRRHTGACRHRGAGRRSQHRADAGGAACAAP
jgi:cysteinyl-tRNA synthetase